MGKGWIMAICAGLGLAACDEGATSAPPEQAQVEVRPAATAAMPPLSAKRRAAFEAAARPVPIALGPGVGADDLLGARLRRITDKDGGRRQNLVRVETMMRAGVDDQSGMAYATCVLSAWGRGQGMRFARHIMTENGKVNGNKTLSTVFTVSQKRPLGLMVVDMKQSVRECKSRGIPAA